METVALFDDNGKPLPTGQRGELVCTQPFPTVPLGFLNDPEHVRFKEAYFDTFKGVWHHGDYCMYTEHGGLVIFGRSDTTLNPGGVRIGTAEIYRQVDKVAAVLESCVISQQWPPAKKDDVRVVLFVKLRAGLVLTEVLSDEIKATIRNSTTPRHVPARIVQVMDIPRTKSGKIVETAVRKIIHGDTVNNVSALDNADALLEYRQLAEQLWLS